jgi:hypothetical protein
MKSILYISTKDKVRKGAQRGKSNLISCSSYLIIIDLILVAGLSFNTPPQTVQSLSSNMKCFILADGNALVSVSATMSSVGQYTRHCRGPDHSGL